MHLNNILVFKKHILPLIKPGQRILEIGPDVLPSTLQGIVKVEGISWETLDVVQRPGVNHVAVNDYQFPFPDSSFDIVLAGQVIEHVKKIWKWVPELQRICKPGGHVCLVSPLSWPYHEAPVDCWRIYPEGMKALCEESNLVCKLAIMESLERERHPELKYYGRTYLGVSCSNMRLSGHIKNIVKRLLLKPIPYANDVILIAQKPA